MSTTATPVRSCPTTSSSEYRKPPKAKRHSTPRSNSPPRSRTQPQTHGNDAPAPFTKEWRPAPSTPWLGEVLLGAVGAVHGELPAIALRAPGGMRRSARTVAPGVSDLAPTEQLAAVTPSTTAAVNRLGLPEAERAVVILVDGLGQCNLQARGERAPFLTS